jgi:hypothetical protein
MLHLNIVYTMYMNKNPSKTPLHTPSVTVENVRKYLPKSDAMVKGHMAQIRQNILSTQPDLVEPTSEPEMVQEDKCNLMYATVMETNQIYTDLTGRFPTTSLSGKKYILII